jgi:hypothetical protein
MTQPGFELRRCHRLDRVNRRRPVYVEFLPQAPNNGGKNIDGGDAVPPDWSGDLD